MLLPEGIGIGLTALLMLAAATGAAVTTTMGAGGGVIQLPDWLALIGLLIASTVLGNLLARFDNRKFRLLFSLVLTVPALRLLWQAGQAVYGST